MAFCRRNPAQILAAVLLVPGLLVGPVAAAEYLYSSTADTVFDVIQAEDPSDFVCLAYAGRAVRQMWDKRVDGESDLDVFLFQAHFRTGAPIDIILNPEFGTPEDARAEAMRYVSGLGQLPAILRGGIRQFGIHKGREGFHAGSGKIFMYQDQATHRIGQNKLEESILHESVHASLDAEYRLSPEWLAAQEADGRFMTAYAARHPEREDLAETLLFAYALIAHPGRIPPVDSRDILAAVPHRIEVVRSILERAPDAVAAPAVPQDCQS